MNDLKQSVQKGLTAEIKADVSYISQNGSREQLLAFRGVLAVTADNTAPSTVGTLGVAGAETAVGHLVDKFIEGAGTATTWVLEHVESKAYYDPQGAAIDDASKSITDAINRK